MCCVPAVPRERRKAKYSTLQDTVEELSGRLGQLSTLEAANNELSTRNTQLELVVKEQNTQLQAQKDTITRQAQQLQTQVCAQCMNIGVPGASGCILQEGLAVCVAFVVRAQGGEVIALGLAAAWQRLLQANWVMTAASKLGCSCCKQTGVGGTVVVYVLVITKCCLVMHHRPCVAEGVRRGQDHLHLNDLQPQCVNFSFANAPQPPCR